MEKFRYANLCCPVCNAKFFDDDDIVVCPICGAPHHRDCFNYEGHCHYESTHGTPEQWVMPTDPKYKKYFPEDDDSHKFDCNDCENKQTQQNSQESQNSQNSQTQQEQPYTPPVFNFTVEQLEEEIDENVKGKDILFFVGSSGFRYLDVFKSQNQRNSAISWNFVAFLFPQLWLASRKLWFLAIPVTLVNIVLSAVFSIIISPLTQAMQASNSIPAINLLTETEQLIAVLLGLCSIAICIFFGLFGDYIYRTVAFKKIRALKKDDPFPREELADAGGCSILNIVVLLFAEQTIANLISIILQQFNIL